MKKYAIPRISRQAREYLRLFVRPFRYFYFNKLFGYNIHSTTIISFGAFLDKTKPDLIYIGKSTNISRGAIILSHDYSRTVWKKTVIGDNCFIGVNAVILPGVHIGDEVVIGAGSIVTKDIESNSLAVGNPARVIRKIKTGAGGRIIE